MTERTSIPAGTTATQWAEELQLDACLAELGGMTVQPALVERILEAAHGRAPTQMLGAARARPWLVAAALLLGSVIVVSVALLRREEDRSAAAPQDPVAKPGQGVTLIADYSDNRVVEVDATGKVVWTLEDVFGAWDAERLANGNVLITEFSVSRVREVDRKGKTVWGYEEIHNPYDADRLPNGNTLIADTFSFPSRVIEVDPKGTVVWELTETVARDGTKKGMRPFDADRLPDGNTLISDVLSDRVIEVDATGRVVLELVGLPNVHDADRLPNGNTLVTLRNRGRVVEIDKNGKEIVSIEGLSSPSDADRLPNGNTLVAENTRVREFDKHGEEVWRKDMTWAVEANRYPK